MYQHFKAIAEAVDLPIILYNVPGRTVADMSNETVLRLAAIPNIVGVKDATGNIGRGTTCCAWRRRSFAVYSGDDPTAMALMLAGGAGNISVTANVAPRAMHEMCARRHGRRHRQGGRASTTKSSRCTRSCSSSRIRCRSNGRWPKWA